MTVKTDSPSYWADLKAEIARKTAETLADYAHRHAQGDITDRELRLVVDALYDATVGLAPRDVTDTLYGLRRELAL